MNDELYLNHFKTPDVCKNIIVEQYEHLFNISTNKHLIIKKLPIFDMDNRNIIPLQVKNICEVLSISLDGVYH